MVGRVDIRPLPSPRPLLLHHLPYLLVFLTEALFLLRILLVLLLGRLVAILALLLLRPLLLLPSRFFCLMPLDLDLDPFLFLPLQLLLFHFWLLLVERPPPRRSPTAPVGCKRPTKQTTPNTLQTTVLVGVITATPQALQVTRTPLAWVTLTSAITANSDTMAKRHRLPRLL